MSCSQSKSEIETEEIIPVNLDLVQDTLRLSNFIDSISYIPLETDSNFLIGRIDKLVVTDEFIFVLDKKLARSVFCFDKEGNKKFKIHRIGRGPGEYVNITDISYNDYTKELLLYCFIRKSVLYFDMKGNFLREMKIPFYTARIYELKNFNKILFCEYNPNKSKFDRALFPNLILLDPNLNVMDENAYFEGYIDKSIVWGTHCDFSCWEDTLSIKLDHSNIVYYIFQNKVVPKYFLDFDKYNVDEVYWKKTKKKGITLREMEIYDQSRHFCETMFYLENINCISFIYRQNCQRNRVFYSKKSGKIYIGKMIINDIDYYSQFDPYVLNQNIFYGVLNAGYIREYEEKASDKSSIPEVLKKINEEDNPIIVAYKIKNNI